MFFVYKGECAVMLSVDEDLFPPNVRATQKYLVLDTLRTGNLFGIKSSVFDHPQTVTFEVTSDVCQVLKISHEVFLEHFGSWEG